MTFCIHTYLNVSVALFSTKQFEDCIAETDFSTTIFSLLNETLLEMNYSILTINIR